MELNGRQIGILLVMSRMILSQSQTPAGKYGWSVKIILHLHPVHVTLDFNPFSWDLLSL
jgi:hypothetical protein